MKTCNARASARGVLHGFKYVDRDPITPEEALALILASGRASERSALAALRCLFPDVAHTVFRSAQELDLIVERGGLYEVAASAACKKLKARFPADSPNMTAVRAALLVSA